MTKETINKANDLVHDIDVLKKVQKTMNANHWVAITTAEKTVKEENFYSDYLIDSFKTFVDEKLEEAQKMFEEL